MTVSRCTNVTLQPGEYTIHKDGTLTTRYSVHSFNSSDYGQKSGLARVCFPFSDNFIRCPKWKFYPGELRRNNSDKSVSYVGANLSYALGNYVTNRDKLTFVCVPKSCLPPSFNLDVFFVFLWVVSIVGLILALILYIPRTNSRYHLKPPLFHMSSLLGTYVFLVLYQFTSSGYRNIWANYLTYCNIFVNFTTYSWLNVIGYDAWRQFHSKRLFSSTPVSAKGFAYRSLYAWGVPALLTLSIVVPEYLDCCGQTQSVERVGIKNDLLHFSVVLGSFTLFIGANIVFFALVVRNLRHLRRELIAVNDCANHICFNIRMHIKLIIVMGLTFTCVIVAIISGPSHELYYIVLDAIVSLQGFHLFLIYGWTPLISKARLLCKV